MRTISIGIVSAFVSCSSLNNSENIEPVWIALTATIGGFDQIVLVDFQDPRRYRVISSNDHGNFYPRFSPDRERLVFLDRLAGYSDNPQIVLYSLREMSSDFLSDSTWPGSVVGGRFPVIWSSDQSVIYFRFRPDPFSDDLYSFDFSNRKMKPLIQTSLTASEYPVCALNSDSLVVFSNDTATTKGPIGFYYWSQTGGYGQYLNNRNLELINVGGINKKAAYHLDWNSSRRLFVFAYSDSSISGYKIAITDLMGSVFEQFTSGDFIDDNPAWGADPNTVFFDRHPPSGGTVTVMVLNTASGEIRELVSPSSINGATNH